MPRARSTRNKPSQSRMSDLPTRKDPISETTTNTKTESSKDPSINDYKLHFELTNIEPKTNDIHLGERDVEQDLQLDTTGPPNLEYQSPATSTRRVEEDRDGSGEPDHGYDQPHQLHVHQSTSVVRSISPQRDQRDHNSRLYPPSYLDTGMQHSYSHHHHENGAGSGSSHHHDQQPPYHHQQQSHSHSSQSPVHPTHQLPPLNVAHQTPSHHNNNSVQHPHPHYYTPQAGPSSHSPHSRSLPLHPASHGGHPSHGHHSPHGHHGHHTPHSQHTPHSHPYSGSPYNGPPSHSGSSMLSHSPHPGMHYSPHQPSPYAPPPYPSHSMHPPPHGPPQMRLGEYLLGLSRHVIPGPNPPPAGSAPYGYSDDHVALFKKETQQTNSKRHTEDKLRREWLSRRLNLMPEIVSRAMVNTGNTESFNMIARLPYPSERPINMTSDMEIFNSHIRVMGAEFPHDGELDWYRAMFVPYDAQLFITRRPAVARCNGRIVVRQPSTLKGGRCRVFVVGYFDHVSQRWEYSTKFAVYGTRFLIKDKDKHSPAKAPKMEVAPTRTS